MMRIAHKGRALTATVAIAILAGCSGGSAGPFGSTALPSAKSIVPEMRAGQTVSPLNKRSIITVKWLFTNKTVADAVVKLGWGKACGKFLCTSYQKKGKTGARGRIVFQNLPTGPTNWCAYAEKGASFGGYCYADHNRPIDSKITVQMPKR
jgi:hypothetical protein